MKVYNTLDRKKVDFVPLKQGKVSMYLCGPTVYDLGHLGHGRSAVAFDVVRRYLILKGYDVKFVSNFTDIDDKMIARAEIAKTTVAQLAEKIIPEYQGDYEKLNVLMADVQPKATEFIKEIIEIIKRLEERGVAYVISDGVYFDVGKYEKYGKLSRQDLDQLKSGARVDINNEKHTPYDFVLWKFYKNGEPFWESPWGNGRPGWHIECSAMAWKLLGESFDIHGGGADLIFPHHECEIAQSEAAFNVPFVKYWLHNGFIEINKEKMSKSLGNFFTLRDIFKDFDPLAVRLLFLQTHYRAPIEFSREILQQAQNGLQRVSDFMRRMENWSNDNEMLDSNFSRELDRLELIFFEAMDDDFETPKALAAFFDLIRVVNKKIDDKSLCDKEKAVVNLLIDKMNSVFAILGTNMTEEFDDDIEKLVKRREEARKAKNWAEADEIRDELLAKGILMEDLPSGTVCKRIKN